MSGFLYICIVGFKITNGEEYFEHIYDFEDSYNSFDRKKNTLQENLGSAFEEELLDVLGDIWKSPYHNNMSNSNSYEYCSLSRVQKILDKYDISYDELSDEFKKKFEIIFRLFEYNLNIYDDIFMFTY